MEEGFMRFLRTIFKKMMAFRGNASQVLLSSSGCAFSSSMLNHTELFRKDNTCITDVDGFRLIQGDYKIHDGMYFLHGHGTVCEFTVPEAKAVALVFKKHPWSGTVGVWVNGSLAAIENLNAPFPFTEPIVVAVSDVAQNITIRLEVLDMPRHDPRCNEVLLSKILRNQNVAAVEDKKDDYYKDVNQEQFDAWNRHVASLGYTADEAHAVVSEAYYKRLDRVFAMSRPGDSVLDVGCGFCSARHLAALADKYALQSYQGLDISREVTDYNNEAMRPFGSRFAFSQGMNTTLPYPDDSFSFIYSGHCLEHSDNIKKTFLELKRVLRPNGILHFFVPLTWDESPEHIYYFNPLCWALLAQEAGMRILKTSFGPHYNPLQNDWDTEVVLVNAIG
jgi:ubiquinone/menaquinone biosynthesis C-methylase UbiE